MPPPDDVDAHPAGASWAGVQDLVGNIYQVKKPLHKPRFTFGGLFLQIAEDVRLIVLMNKQYSSLSWFREVTRLCMVTSDQKNLHG